MHAPDAAIKFISREYRHTPFKLRNIQTPMKFNNNYIYIYIYRERERYKSMRLANKINYPSESTKTYIYIYIHIYNYAYDIALWSGPDAVAAAPRPQAGGGI